MASTTGKAHAVIPAFTFYRDRTGDEEEKHGKRGKNIFKKSVSYRCIHMYFGHVNVQSFPKVRFSDFYDWLVHSLLCEMSQVCFLGVTSDRNGITIKSESGYNLKIVCTKEARSGHLKKPFSYFLSLSCHFLPELWLRRHDH